MRVDDLKGKGTNTRQKELDQKKKLFSIISLTFVISIVLLILWILIFKNTSRIRTFKNEYLSFEYDSSWTVSRNNKEVVSLTHSTKSFVDIKISKLATNYLNSDISSIVDEVKYDIEKQDSNYKLLKEEKKDISKNKYNSYKMLYENGDSQSLVIVLRNKEYLYVINYTSNNEYFDILLDSFQTVLGSIELK